MSKVRAGALRRPGRTALRTVAVVAAAVLLALAVGAQAAEDLPRTEDELIAAVRTAIEQRDYGRFDQLLVWDGAGKIKKRVVAYQVRRGLGRPIRSITFEPFPADALDGVKRSGRHRINLPVTHTLRVVYDEPPVDGTGKPPTSVFLIGKRGDSYRIALMVRNFDDDDGD